jgi:hypothetical protein
MKKCCIVTVGDGMLQLQPSKNLSPEFTGSFWITNQICWSTTVCTTVYYFTQSAVHYSTLYQSTIPWRGLHGCWIAYCSTIIEANFSLNLPNCGSKHGVCQIHHSLGISNTAFIIICTESALWEWAWCSSSTVISPLNLSLSGLEQGIVFHLYCLYQIHFILEFSTMLLFLLHKCSSLKLPHSVTEHGIHNVPSPFFTDCIEHSVCNLLSHWLSFSQFYSYVF